MSSRRRGPLVRQLLLNLLLTHVAADCPRHESVRDLATGRMHVVALARRRPLEVVGGRGGYACGGLLPAHVLVVRGVMVGVLRAVSAETGRTVHRGVRIMMPVLTGGMLAACRQRILSGYLLVTSLAEVAAGANAAHPV